jgi:hypothetical protein
MVIRTASFLLISLVVILSGCMTLNGPLAYRYVPPLSNTPPLPFRLSIEKFRDGRPALTPAAPPSATAGAEPEPSGAARPEPLSGSGDRESTQRIEPVDAQVTMALLEDFRVSRFFESVDSAGSRPSSTLVMRGTIWRFTWSERPSPILYIPVINLLTLFGIPIEYTSATVSFQIELVDPRTEKMLTEYDLTEQIDDTFTLYDQSVEAGAELATALRSVSQQLKAYIRSDYESGKFSTIPSGGRSPR